MDEWDEYVLFQKELDEHMDKLVEEFLRLKEGEKNE